MPARTGSSYYIPGKGTTTRSKSGKAKTFSGKGPAPPGTKKTPEKSYLEVPTVTVTSSGTTTSGFKRQTAAKRAVRTQRIRSRRVKRIVNQVDRAAQKRSRPPKPLPKYTPPKPGPASTAVISSTPNPRAKPPTFQGNKTAGAPTRKELQAAARTGTLKVSKSGFATTPKVRRVGGELRQLRAQSRSSNAPLPGLGPEESKVARKVLRTGKRKGANRKELLAASETGLVETGFKNLSGGTSDSAGWRQERAMYYPNPTNVKAAAGRFFTETKTDTGGARGRGQTAGQLAQTVQASAYPERYDERKPEAAAILHAFNKGGLKPGQQRKLKKVTKQAKALGLKTAGKSVGPAPKKVVSRFKAAKVAMKEIEGLPYVWGGGHGSPTSSPTGGGLDCSGAVGYVLNKIGAMKGSLTSGDMGSVLKPGPGALTVFYNAGHTFLRLGNEYWGTSVGDSGAGGLGPHGAPSAAYLSEYSVGHVPGLGRKQALQLGFKNLSGGGSEVFPGMTLSASGTTATINEGAGTTKSGKPGFSKQPIQLTPLQKYNRTSRKLKNLGVGSSTTTTSQPSSPTLKALEEKYGVAAA